MKKIYCYISVFSLVFGLLTSCDVPSTSTAAKAAARATEVAATTTVNTRSSTDSTDGKQIEETTGVTTTGNNETEKTKETVPTKTSNNITPDAFKGKTYFGIRVLDPSKDFKDEDNDLDEVADRRLTLKFESGGNDLTASWEDSDGPGPGQTPQNNTNKKTKTGLKVEINDQEITLKDGSNVFLKFKFQKPTTDTAPQFIYITEDNSDDTKPDELKTEKVSYVGTGLALDGQEASLANIRGANEDRVTPPIPKNPFESIR